MEVLIKGFRYNNPAIFLAQRNSDCDHRHSLERSGLLRAYAPPARRERKGNPVRKSKQDAEAPSPLACDVRSTPENRLKKASIRNLTRSMHSARLPRRSFKVSGANPCRRSTCTSLIQAPSTYVRGYPSKEERDKRLKAVRDDPDFAEVVTKQEAHLARAREYNMERDFEM